MSFEIQNGASTCGLASLRYAFSLLGAGLRRNRELEEGDVRALMKKSSWCVFRDGTDEHNLKRAAAKLGMVMTFRRFYARDADQVIEELRRATGEGHPCIVCVHDDDDAFFHWICVAGFSGNWALVFDPSTLDEGDYSESTYWLADNDGDADFSPGLMKVSRLAAWIDTTNEMAEEIEDEYGGEHHLFLELSVASARRGDFVPGMADEALLRRMRLDLDLASSFDQYIDDLRDVFGTPRWNGGSKGEPAHRFIDKNRARIDELFSRWTLKEFCSRDDMEQEIENLLAITRCYGFTVTSGEETRAWANLAFYLGWWAAECSYEVGKFEG